MKLRLIISGGQTGADQTGLIAGRTLGIQTAGTAPKNYRTERGSEKWLKDYGLVESPHYDYAPRTRQNVLDAGVTLWFGNLGSPGYWCTVKAAENLTKDFEANITAERFAQLCDEHEIINIAGNRFSKNPNVIKKTLEAFAGIGLKEVSAENLKLLIGRDL